MGARCCASTDGALGICISTFIYFQFGGSQCPPEFPKSLRSINAGIDVKKKYAWGLPSRELTYPHPKGTFEDDFPFPLVGYVSFLHSIQHAWISGSGLQPGKSPTAFCIVPWTSYGEELEMSCFLSCDSLVNQHGHRESIVWMVFTRKDGGFQSQS